MDARNVGREVVGGQPPRGFQLDLRGHGLDLTEGQRRYAAEHVAAKLAKHARWIDAVIIRFEDVNGSRGGVDKCCRIEVVVRGAAPLVVEEVDADLREAMDRGVNLMQTAVSRERARRRQTPRQRGRK